MLTETDFFYSLSDGENPQIVIPRPGFVYAPVVKGQNAGIAYVCIGDHVIGEIPLQYGETVEMIQKQKVSFWKRLTGGDK